MASLGVSVSRNSSSIDFEVYIFHSTIYMLELICQKITLATYAIVLLVSVIQTFWKNKRLDRLFASMNEAYSNGKFGSVKACFREQTITCYHYDQRFSHIPNPNRLILPIISTHIQILIRVAFTTVFTRRNEPVNDCFAFHLPYEILQCEDYRDPCQFNGTESVPKCTFYYFEMANLITMVTSVITWHFGLRYFVVKLVRLMRRMMFRDDDQPRRLCCCLQPTQRRVRYLMRFQYTILWLYFFIMILFGFVWNSDLTRVSIDLLGPAWVPIILAGDRLCFLTAAIAPELLQNWLDVSAKLEVLQVLHSNGLHLAHTEPLVHLIDKKINLCALLKNHSSTDTIKSIAQM